LTVDGKDIEKAIDWQAVQLKAIVFDKHFLFMEEGDNNYFPKLYGKMLAI
jgi:hypothetical protein